ncbi:MAG: hypothetical protein A2252_03470 [Elusimicrobia bacterium RIFOXYA2_FULL_39_19]|nr:MAG: hypothetical protein A2252_03470 [Elusimicrobia bacterium RIFOXYA2_FULL_39_19]
MKYKGIFKTFDNSKIRTYPLNKRKSKVSLEFAVDCKHLAKQKITHPNKDIEKIALGVIKARKQNKPVIIMSGAHLVKNGLSPIIVDLMEKRLITLFATNVASSIHSFELSLIGQSSENVAKGLPKGEFGMAFETGMYLNQTLIEGLKAGIGFGESMGRLYGDKKFRKKVIDNALKNEKNTDNYYKPYGAFRFADSCIFAKAFELKIPVTVHASLGTDIIDQHRNFNGRAKGETSGKDFLIFANEITKLTHGGVIINIGSAVMGPEVLLKAVSMAANTGKVPNKIITADFDLRPFGNNAADEKKYPYYFRDQKSIVNRIPESYHGTGYYIQGNQKETVPSFYKYIISHF